MDWMSCSSRRLKAWSSMRGVRVPARSSWTSHRRKQRHTNVSAGRIAPYPHTTPSKKPASLRCLNTPRGSGEILQERHAARDAALTALADDASSWLARLLMLQAGQKVIDRAVGVFHDDVLANAGRDQSTSNTKPGNLQWEP